MNLSRPAPRWMALFLVLLFGGSGVSAQSEPSPSPVARPLDRVWIEPQRPTASQSDWYARPILQRTGTILSLDRDSLRWIVAGDEVESVISAGRVLWIKPAGRSDKETAALQLFTAGKYSESLRPLLDVLSERPPVWRQQFLSMLAAYAAWQSSREAIALELVSQLDQRPLPPLTLAWLPIAWRGGVVRRSAVDAATSRLSDPSPAVRLVAASWLLTGATRTQAATVLKALSNDNERPHVARLAECLLWRLATPPEVGASSQQWMQTLETLPMTLQVGPVIALSDKMRSAGQTDAAHYLEMSLKVTAPVPHPAISAR